jgi:hypothetical protein
MRRFAELRKSRRPRRADSLAGPSLMVEQLRNGESLRELWGTALPEWSSGAALVGLNPEAGGARSLALHTRVAVNAGNSRCRRRQTSHPRVRRTILWTQPRAHHALLHRASTCAEVIAGYAPPVAQLGSRKLW